MNRYCVGCTVNYHIVPFKCSLASVAEILTKELCMNLQLVQCDQNPCLVTLRPHMRFPQTHLILFIAGAIPLILGQEDE